MPNNAWFRYTLTDRLADNINTLAHILRGDAASSTARADAAAMHKRDTSTR